MDNKSILLSLENVSMNFELRKSFGVLGKKSFIKAVDNVSFEIYENETFGLVGESGSGKTTLGKVILRLYKKSLGRIIYKDRNLCEASNTKMRALRKELQIVFQDPYSSLNPRLTVGQLLSEALIAHNMFKKGDKVLDDYVLDIMQKCGLQPYMMHRYPHQFSGGQRQRIGIARALALNPTFVVCDEAVSTLDISIQSQILNLLLDLKEQNNLTYLFISHDLSTVQFISDRIAVMYLGNIVELASSSEIFTKPLHPYTQALIDAIPKISDEPKKEIYAIAGDVPSATNPPSGCKFHPRCTFAREICKKEKPVWKEQSKGHFVACHNPQLVATEVV